MSSKTVGDLEAELEILRMIERATQPQAYQEKLQGRTIVEFVEDRKRLIDQLWNLYESLSTE